MAGNPRHRNRNFRRKMQNRFRAACAPCGICRGALGPIRYDQPSDAAHPLSFVIDEIIPVSRWREFGFASPEAVAENVENLQPAHWVCNARKGAKIQAAGGPRFAANVSDGSW